MLSEVDLMCVEALLKLAALGTFLLAWLAVFWQLRGLNGCRESPGTNTGGRFEWSADGSSLTRFRVRRGSEA